MKPTTTKPATKPATKPLTKNQLLSASWEAAISKSIHARSIEALNAEGWETSRSFAEKRGVSFDQAVGVLKSMFDQGILEREKMRVKTGDTTAHIVYCYRPKP
ncbi:MAG: hypothetical protein WCL08_04290 [Verrucomicrobiota bacterium]